MKLKEKIKEFRASKKRYLVTLFLAILVLILGIVSFYKGRTRENLVYRDSLDKVAVTVNGEDLTLRDIAFYVAYEESEVNEHALVYDASNPRKYWELHINGAFVKVAAKNAVIQMAIHDELFYQLAEEEEITLSEEDEALLDNSVADFWYDLTDYNRQEGLGVSYDDIYQTMRKSAIAQKYQEILVAKNNADTEDFDFSGENYKEFLENYSYKINESVWNRVGIGEVTL